MKTTPRSTAASSDVAALTDQTWNTCPDCHHTWREKVPVVGVVHRTARCAACQRTADADARFKAGWTA